MQKKNTIISKLSSPLFYILLILIWQEIYYIGTDFFQWWKPYALPNPIGVLNSIRKMAESGVLLQATAYSLKRALIGFSLSVIIGTLLGLLISISGYCKRNLKPLLTGIQSLPSVCWVPFAILWFGLDESAILFVVVIGSTFSVSLTIENAIHTIPPIYVKVARTMGANKFQLYKDVMIPAALPGFLAGLKQSWSFAWRALMSGEVMSAYVGLGYTLMTGRDIADINQVTAVMLVIILVGILIDYVIFSNLESHVLKKHGL